MENLRENRLLLYSILAPSILVVMLSMGLSTDLTNTFEIVDFPSEVSDLLFLQNIEYIEISMDFSEYSFGKPSSWCWWPIQPLPSSSIVCAPSCSVNGDKNLIFF